MRLVLLANSYCSKALINQILRVLGPDIMPYIRVQGKDVHVGARRVL